MRPSENIRQRFMRDDPTVRLGGLAANLARVYSFADHPGHGDAVERIVNESRYFIEWTAPYIELDQQVQLVDLQRRLCDWQISWQHVWSDPRARHSMAAEAKTWSDRLLTMSGLLEN
jgi:hypothetical protein